MILANVEIAGKFISTTHEVDYGADGADAEHRATDTECWGGCDGGVG